MLSTRLIGSSKGAAGVGCTGAAAPLCADVPAAAVSWLAVCLEMATEILLVVVGLCGCCTLRNWPGWALRELTQPPWQL